jgi:GDSL-like Lipase/Acylhydrolase family
LRLRLAECLLVLVSTGLTCLAAEAAFSLVGLRYVPLRLHGELPEEIRVFAQSSKAGVLPRNPVLLLGDSYAQGFGDWLLEANANGNAPFHSGHVIQAQTGRDVITLGVSGAGSAEGMAAFPAIAYKHAAQAWYLRLPKPSVAVVYFYEGNDLNNNLTFLEQRAANPDAGDLAERIDRSIEAYRQALFVDTGWSRHFPLLRLLLRLAQQAYAETTGVAQPPVPEDPTITAQSFSPNAVEVAGKAAELPGHLQSPALELTRAEIERGTLVYERSLVFLQKLLPGTPILVVYVPSPLSSYRLLGSEVSSQQYVADAATHYPRARVPEYSNAICALIRTATIGHGAGFLDLRPAIRDASGRAFVHGPRDFKHFNRKGMEVLGQAVADRIDRSLVGGPCSPIEN